MRPAVSVVCATYNSAATLRCAVASALGQTCQDLEVIVVGDGCTDDSEAVVRALGDGRVRWIARAANSGSQATPNREALALARAPHVAYLGHDDLWLPWHLEALLARQAETGAPLVHTSTILIEPGGPRHLLGPGPLPHPRQWFVPPSTWLHTRALAERLPLWRDPDTLPWPVDHDILIQLRHARVPIAHHDEVTVLKFASPAWRLYARRDGHPQPAILAELRADPQALQAHLLAQHREWVANRPPPTRAERVRQARNAMRNRALDWGAGVWPFSRLLVRDWQRVRRKLRGTRGLLP